MASHRRAGESGQTFPTNLRFFLHNLKSRRPNSVQAKSFRAKSITILFANVELHREKKKKKKEEKKTKLAI